MMIVKVLKPHAITILVCIKLIYFALGGALNILNSTQISHEN